MTPEQTADAVMALMWEQLATDTDDGIAPWSEAEESDIRALLVALLRDATDPEAHPVWSPV